MKRPTFLVALLLTFTVGALVGTIFGFVVFLRSPQAQYAAGFSTWLKYPVQLGWWPWPVFGGLIISLLYVILRLSRFARRGAFDLKHFNNEPISESGGTDASKRPPKREDIPNNEIRCPSCSALNRVPNYFVSRIPSCGKCHKALPERPAKKIFRQVYRFRWVCFLFCVLLLVWHPWANNFTSSTPSTTSTSQDTCSLRPQPSQGVYRSYTELPRIAPLTIKTAPGASYFVKLEDAASSSLVMSFFIHGGSTLQARVPLGSFVLKYATGEYWCGDRELFGPDTATKKADYIFTFVRDVSETRHGYATSISHHTIELIRQIGGNLRTILIRRDEF